MRLMDAESEILEATHGEVAAYVVEQWGLPDSIVEAIAFHACPSRCPVAEIGVLTVVHLASGLSEHIGGAVGVDDYSDPANAAHEDRVLPFGGEVEVVRLILEYEDGSTEAIIEDGAYSIPAPD